MGREPSTALTLVFHGVTRREPRAPIAGKTMAVARGTHRMTILPSPHTFAACDEATPIIKSVTTMFVGAVDHTVTTGTITTAIVSINVRSRGRDGWSKGRCLVGVTGTTSLFHTGDS